MRYVLKLRQSTRRCAHAALVCQVINKLFPPVAARCAQLHWLHHWSNDVRLLFLCRGRALARGS
jgi:hypothetical protein